MPLLKIILHRRSLACRGPTDLIAPLLVGLAMAFSISTPAIAQTSPDGQAEAFDFFESKIRPLFAQHCQQCHGREKQASGLRVDSRAALLTGGDRGPAIVPRRPDESILLDAVRHQQDLQMPPERTLTTAEISAIEHWIHIGAPWPTTTADGPPQGNRPKPSNAERHHWAFQPITDPTPPKRVDPWIRNPIDGFVKQRLDDRGLSPASPADRRTLIHRVHYTLTGLPPSFQAVERFAHDRSPDAYRRLVDRLLQSPQYGQHWARHWLDIARYSDTKGYVYAREERRWVHAWAYRDWVTDAFNENMPLNRFLLLQLAADQVSDRRRTDLAAMGFLTLGRRFLGVQRDIIDDRIDVVTRGMLGLTVACARCHDHKYDPIPTEDYYSLYGVFNSSRESLMSLSNDRADPEFRDELEKRQRKLNDRLATSRAESSQRCRQRVSDYLNAQTELEKYPANGFDQIFQKTDLLPAFVRRWEDYLYNAKQRRDPVFVAWHAYAELSADQFAVQSEAVTRELADLTSDQIDPRVASKFATPPSSFDDVVTRYGQLFDEIRDQHEPHRGETSDDDRRSGCPCGAAASPLIDVLYGPDSPCTVPDEPIVHTETFFDSATCTELWKLQGEVDRWINGHERGVPFALTLEDRTRPREPRVFRRGDPLNQGPYVPRRFLSVLSEKDETFGQGSGRLELAEAIIDPANPLTARVLVNRVWSHHFGRGLVTTPSDFGTRSTPPSHPDLLDWLASRLIAEDWDLKKLHRRILLSATYRQSSLPEDSPSFTQAISIDSENRLLWRMNPRRLTFEEFRDSLLTASGQLDRSLGGKPAKLFEQPLTSRRTLYGLVDRQYLPGTLRVFDFANPDLHVAKRAETTVPQQALFLLNDELVLQRVAVLADQARKCETHRESIDLLFKQALRRSPTDREMADALQWLESHRAGEREEQPPSTAKDWQYGFGELNESLQRVENFTALPHFTGKAWQGGADWPDAELGWVRLTASGGHPGNDRQHAAVRRWTAPRAMRVQIRSQLVHDAAPGDGIRAFVVASRGGILASTQLHQDSDALNVDRLDVERGDTIDFVVDIGDVLNSDQYEWTQTIRHQDSFTSGETTRWDSAKDFPVKPVPSTDPWHQLAQILVCTNEFMFID